MSITITLATLLAAIPYLLILVLAWAMFQQHKRIFRLEAFNKGLIAHAQDSQARPEPVIVKGWLELYESLPEGTPKWTAYRNRLISVGVLDSEGNRVDGVGDRQRK